MLALLLRNHSPLALYDYRRRGVVSQHRIRLAGQSYLSVGDLDSCSSKKHAARLVAHRLARSVTQIVGELIDEFWQAALPPGSRRCTLGSRGRTAAA